MTAPGAGSDGFDTDVLIVGAGPTGATAALALATYGVRAHAISRWNWLANGPRAHITNQRAVEVLRDLGVEEEATKHATPWDRMGDTLFTTSLAGPEIARLRTWGTGDDRIGDYVKGSPCPLLDIPQPWMEPTLVNAAAARGARFSFNTEYLSHVQDEEGVTVALRDLTAGHDRTVRARYLIGADGARSQIVDELGLPLDGELARAATAYVLFHADLTRHVAHRPAILHWLMTPTANYGEIGMGLLRAIRPWHTWIAGWGYDLSGPGPDFSPDAVTARIRGYVGDPELEIEIESCSSWYVNQAHARRYSRGRVFCGGDAVHRHPPSSGLGSNTSIQDAFNLAWKLAYVIQGYADPALLETYSDERVPVGRQVVARANQSRKDYAPLNACFATTGEADPIAAGLAKLRDPGPDGVAVREALTAALELKNYEFNAQGVELNQRYSSTAVIPDPTAGEEEFARDRDLYLQATTRPGAKLPHTWLVDRRGHRVSTLDVTGRGHMSLVTGLAGRAWERAAAKLDLPFLRTVVIGESGLEDPYRDWARAREIHEAGALLVRPDGYVAWRQPTAVWDDRDALTQLHAALSAVLGPRENQLVSLSDDVRQKLAIDTTSTIEDRTIDITTTGRRTGLPRRIEIVFYRLDGDVYLSGIPAPKERDWLANLSAHPQFTFHLKHDVVADLPAVATVVTDDAERRRVLAVFVDEFNRRHGPDGPWPTAVLEEWVERSPLAKVTFAGD